LKGTVPSELWIQQPKIGIARNGSPPSIFHQALRQILAKGMDGCFYSENDDSAMDGMWRYIFQIFSDLPICIYLEVSIVMGLPPNHPFIDGFPL
jgi:hypothetical protein